MQGLLPKKNDGGRVIALAGNPNVGKSTIFNALTGMHQHTGNWPGKTVALASGAYSFRGQRYILTDLPGTYSLLSRSPEEEVAAAFVRSGQADCVVVICDGTCLERTLLLALQIMELTDRVVLCVNLMDEAARRGVEIDALCLEHQLGIPVVTTSLGDGEALERLKETVREVCDGFLCPHPVCTLAPGADFMGAVGAESDRIAVKFVRRAEALASSAASGGGICRRDARLDRIFAGKFTGYPILLLLLFGIFWLTIQGANYPSALLQSGFDRLLLLLRRLMQHAPWWLSGVLLDGVFATTGRVVSVMLPPMAIFFPLFTLLEDFGYLPRAAFLTDRLFACAGTCGKQALTTAMGFGCNAVGVTGCRIIDSPRERLIAILTNAFLPCNGRFPALILLIGLLLGGSSSAACSALVLTTAVLFSFAVSLLVSALLSRTLLRGAPSSFALELPSYRRPQVGKVIVRSILDRTLFVLGRAVAVAAPAGLVIWVLANVQVGGGSLLVAMAQAFQPVGLALGMNGALLLAFVLGFPANELVLPVTVLILTAGVSVGGELSGTQMTAALLSGGMDWKMALCTLLFFLFHWPCSTTVLTIRKETGSWKWTLLSMVLPTAVGAALCLTVNLLF